MVKKKMKKTESCCVSGKGGCGGAVYGLGFVGALVYYLGAASGFWIGVLGILKAIVWPAMLVFEVLKLVAA